jgi:hypothetical protein
MELSASFDVDALPLSKGVNRQTREYMGKKRKEEKKKTKKKKIPPKDERLNTSGFIQNVIM